MTLFKNSNTIKLVLPYSLLFLLSSFEEICCLLSWLCCFSTDLGSVSLSVTLFRDAVKWFSKLVRETGWVSRLPFSNFPIISSNVSIIWFWSVVLLLKLWVDGRKFLLYCLLKIQNFQGVVSVLLLWLVQFLFVIHKIMTSNAVTLYRFQSLFIL